ncbi:MSMEG_0567/sll0787 family protein [Nocardioides alkalitolerans]|uniref:MSMEG_0567/sll0787 family protein n=1 Tax=Nocardioides alkalitolerans TaxID=281714 RepID=UPI00040F58F7|nr:MSMEG_0567/sll0787 family protein [Nocardioides alkalitolerans]
MTLDAHVLTGLRTTRPAGDPGTPAGPGDPAGRPAPYVVAEATTPADLAAYRRLRHDVFVTEQRLFAVSDTDLVDDDPRTVVLLARASADGAVLGGVRLHPAPDADGTPPATDLGWWRGGRLAVAADARTTQGIGPALVRAACARAEAAGALRFDAVVQAGNERLFRRLGWRTRASVSAHGQPHVVMDWPLDRVQRLADATKAALGGLLGELATGVPAGFVGDDGAPVPGSDLVAACDAILPSMVERDPEWAGWCSVLVNVNDLAAMGAAPVGLLDAVAARDASFARRVLRGLTEAAQAWGVAVLGGHTQLGVPAALSVTALGRTARPVPGGGGRPGDRLRLTADLGGDWRPGYTGAQWDSTSRRTPAQLRAQAGLVPALAPTAAKDVSMSGLVGTTGMLAEAGGCRAVLDVAAIPTPAGARTGDWLTCFPGFAMITAEAPHTPAAPALPDDLGHLTTAVTGTLVEGAGVGLRWPDGVVTEAIRHTVTGMGPA